MKARLILVSLGLALMALLSLGTQAQETKNKDDLVASNQQIAGLFNNFQNELFRLQVRLARGNAEERKTAEDLAKVLEECKNLAINQEFSKMAEILKGMDVKSTNDTKNALVQSENIADRLGKIVAMVQDTKGTRLTKDRQDLEKVIEDIRKAIERQQIAEGLTKRSKTDPKDLAKLQENITKDTAKIADKINDIIGKDKGAPKGGEALPTKGDAKPGDKADGGKSGEAKPDNAKPTEGAQGKTKNDGGKESSQGPKSDAKPGGKGNEGKKAESTEPKPSAKPGEKAGSESPPAGAKKEDANAKKGGEGSAKPSQGDKSPKGGEGGAKDAGKKGDPKDSPQGSAKGSDDNKKQQSPSDKQSSPDASAKPGGGGDPMGGGQKPEASKAGGGDPKAGGDSKAGGDAKGGEAGSKSGDSKAGPSKDGQSQAKDGGKGGGGGMGGDEGGAQADAKPGGGGPSPPPPPGGGGPEKDKLKDSAKRVVEAGYDQKIAEENIKKEDNPAAAKNEADAIAKLQEAQKQLEKLLRQIREEELERVLAALQARCEKMLIMQKQVYRGTQDLDAIILKNDDKKPTAINQRESLKLADEEKKIVQEANKCIDILEAEGSAVAFPEVFQQIRQDMMHVQKRLELTDAGDVTQGIERDIIDTLEEMVKALKDARDNNKDSAKAPPPGKPGAPGKQGDQTLLKLIQELKMVRSLQDRINKRTTATRFSDQEQANDPQVVRELRNLGERQRRIQEIVDKIAKGDNK